MKPTQCLTAVVLLFLAASLPLLAHHSLTTEFDFNTMVDHHSARSSTGKEQIHDSTGIRHDL